MCALVAVNARLSDGLTVPNAVDAQAVPLRALGHGRREEEVSPLCLHRVRIGLEVHGASTLDDPVPEEHVTFDGRTEDQYRLALARDLLSHVTAGAVVCQLPGRVQEVLLADGFLKLELRLAAGLARLHDGLEPTRVSVGDGPFDQELGCVRVHQGPPHGACSAGNLCPRAFLYLLMEINKEVLAGVELDSLRKSSSPAG